MSTNIFSVLNTAKVALLAQQLAIEVTGQNIANVETEGYSRLEVVFEANSPLRIGSAVIGTGVKVAGVERIHDFFLFKQILSEGDPTGNFRIRKDVFDQLEILFNESSGRSLNDALGRFFGSLQDLSTNPSGLPERAAVLEEAKNVVAVFKQMGDELLRIQASINSSISNV